MMGTLLDEAALRKVGSLLSDRMSLSPLRLIENGSSSVRDPLKEKGFYERYSLKRKIHWETEQTNEHERRV
jgi:hypothetical protein